VLDTEVAHGRDHHPRPARQTRQERAGLVERFGEAAAAGGQAGLDGAPLLFTDIAHFHQPVDKQA